MNDKNNNSALGIDSQPIDKKKANEIIGTYCKLNGNIRRYLRRKPASDEEQEMVDRFRDHKAKFNAFVFEKDDILRFFDKELGATHLMIILGAHSEKEVSQDEDFKKGSFTIVAAGCKHGGGTTYSSLPLNEPATEYPPKLVRSTLDNIHENLLFIVEE
ncbi:hypothetical protein C900_02083 [Fulvivirga imtechensis AK7]|uniref:Uncharacterized protein n=1 Tax=Fulvivirga imtechensis AK7 TaxID=1237149 RepID=L8K181_9BACT|nr:hypothetical protein [Fulvivirga imtechensis]ELR73679.1 hypothetical protein C900_02083 [Fulvivirga imtechensis AK7]